MGLKCYPCPHNGACCKYGSSLSQQEADLIIADFGEEAIQYTNDLIDPIRTKVINDSCYFLKYGICHIHDKPYYPKVCKGFPWEDADGNSYQHDQSICPEL